MFTASELIDLAIQVEVNGERFYRYAMGRVKRGPLRKLLGWLADQELLHKRAFVEIKGKIAHGTKSAPSFSSLTQQALRRAMGRHAFSLDELQIDSILDEEEVLRTALLFEEDTILFFEFIAAFVSDPGAASTLEKIRAEEFNHKQLLMEKISEI
jgi:rubrerythrin